MEKILIKTNDDVKAAISFFGRKYADEIKNEVSKKPCVLIGSYSEDIEFGSGYDFDSVAINDFETQKNGEVFR